jgi:DNA-3-methyladenine glycosylase
VSSPPAWPSPALALLGRDFLDRPAIQVAPDLLGCVLVHQTAAGLVAVRLTEVEAYAGSADPASHAYRGQTARNAVMFGPPGHAYVYFTYGMHFCVNLVCQPAGTAEAVLLRAGEVIAGEELARFRRPAALSSRDLTRGPARLCQALGIDRCLDGADVCDTESPLRILQFRTVPEDPIRTGPRVGVREGAEVPWRFWLDGEPTVSVYRPYVPRKRGAARTLTSDLTKVCSTRRVLHAPRGTAHRKVWPGPGAPPVTFFFRGSHASACSSRRLRAAGGGIVQVLATSRQDPGNQVDT